MRVGSSQEPWSAERFRGRVSGVIKNHGARSVEMGAFLSCFFGVSVPFCEAGVSVSLFERTPPAVFIKGCSINYGIRNVQKKMLTFWLLFVS